MWGAMDGRGLSRAAWAQLIMVLPPCLTDHLAQISEPRSQQPRQSWRRNKNPPGSPRPARVMFSHLSLYE